MSKIKVTTIMSTERAHLVQSSDGRTAWIQSRSLTDRSLANADIFNKVPIEIESYASDLRKQIIESVTDELREQMNRSTNKFLDGKITREEHRVHIAHIDRTLKTLGKNWRDLSDH